MGEQMTSSNAGTEIREPDDRQLQSAMDVESRGQQGLFADGGYEWPTSVAPMKFRPADWP